MSHDRMALLPDSLLDALEKDEEFDARARGDDTAGPGYFLHALPVPELARLRPSVNLQVTSQAREQVSGAQSDVPVTAPDESGFGGSVACPQCGASNSLSARFCHACGTRIASDAKSTENSGNAASLTGALRAPAALAVSLVCINEDGTDGTRIDLQYNDSIIGRAGDIRYATDAFLSPKHARLTIEHGKLFIEDLYSLNGTYVKLREEKRLTPGDTFLMGRQVLRFEKFEAQIVPKARANDGTRYMGSPPPTGHFKLVQVGIGGVTQNVFCLYDSGAVIGREKGDIIFPRDKFMSGRHAQLYPRDDGHYYLTDMGSSNGTWVKIWERRELRAGDFVFLGQQLFRVEVAPR